MTNEQAKSELMQIYMSLSEEKKKAIDVLINPLSEEDYTELRDRFGSAVESVIRDMVSGKGERWEQAQTESEDAISREELLKAINTWDRFGVDDTNSLFRLDNLSLPHYVPYIHYDDVVKCIKGMPPVKPQPCEDAISRAEAIRVASGYCHPSNIAKELDKLPPINPQPKTGHCEDCKYFRKLPYHTDTLGKCVHYKCVHHKGFCPKGDYWYCADFEMD